MIEFTDINDHPFLRNDFEVPNPFEFEGVFFDTAEHAFQAAKTDSTTERESMSEMTVRGVREYARSLDIDTYDWDSRKYFVMQNVLKEKFKQNPDLANKLAAVKGGIKMISNRDSFWGTGPDGNGENNLGEILSKIRDELSSSHTVYSSTVATDTVSDDGIRDFKFSLSQPEEEPEEEDDSDEEVSVSQAVAASSVSEFFTNVIDDTFNRASDDLEEVFDTADKICEWHNNMPGALSLHPELEKLIEKLGEKVADAKKEIKEVAANSKE